jgi:hypothetical protein
MNKMKKYMSHGSHASIGAHTGGGFMAGTNEQKSANAMPGKNGIRQASGGKDMEFPTAPAASNAAPKGMKTYREE